MQNLFPHRLLLTTALMAVLSLGLAACATDEDDDMGVPNDPVTINDNTPPPLTEVTENIPVIDNPQGWIWRSGYWALSAPGNFVWVPGKVIPRPSPTAAWGKARWMHHQYGWTFEPGHWE